MELLISTQGDEAIQRRFSKLARNTGNATPVFLEITALLAESNEKSWARGVKLADSTMEQHQRDGTEPLVKTGKTKESLTKKDGAGDAIRTITPHEMVFGSKTVAAHFLQYGTKNMPKKRVMKFTPKTRKTIKVLLANHIMGHSE